MNFTRIETEKHFWHTSLLNADPPRGTFGILLAAAHAGQPGEDERWLQPVNLGSDAETAPTHLIGIAGSAAPIVPSANSQMANISPRPAPPLGVEDGALLSAVAILAELPDGTDALGVGLGALDSHALVLDAGHPPRTVPTSVLGTETLPTNESVTAWVCQRTLSRLASSRPTRLPDRTKSTPIPSRAHVPIGHTDSIPANVVSIRTLSLPICGTALTAAHANS